MIFMKMATQEFRLGMMLHHVGLEAHFGWYGIMILWSKQNEN